MTNNNMEGGNTIHGEDTTTMQRDDDHRQGRSLFLRTMCDDAKSSSLTTIEGNDDDASKRRGCARIRVDGSIVSSSSSNDDKAADFRFSTAFCLPPSSSHRDDYHSVGGIGNERQMKTVARLSAIQLVGRRGNAAMANDDNTTSSSSSSDDTTAIGKSRGSGAGVGRWYESITQKVNRIIDVALATLDGSSAADDEMRYLEDSSSTNHAAVAVGKRGDDENEEDDVNNVKKLLLATESSNMPNNVKVDCDDDNNVGEGDQTSVEVEICDTDTVIDVITLATTCRSIINQLISSLDDELKSNSSNGDKFFIPRSSGCKDNSQQRIMLHRVGWGISSFGALCVQAAKAQGSSSSTILSNISQDVDLELLVQTLIESNYALVHGGENGDVITIYPHGIPRPPPTTTDNNATTEPPSEKKSSSLSSSSSSSVIDMALFQIHNTKITIQTRMTQLEHNATQSKIAAMKSQRSGMTQIALRHMRHHKLLIDEISHCATLLTNLDSMELRLCRTEDDKQIVHSYTLVKEAYQMIRKSATGIDGVDDVDELIMDIQDEMDEIDEVGRSMMMTNLSSSVVDSLDDVDDELNVEFHRLELECKEEGQQQQQQQRQRPKVEKVDTKEDDKLEPLLLAAVTEQPNDGVSEISNVRQSQPDCQAKALPV